MIGSPDIFWLQICGMRENEARLRRMARASREALFPLVLMSASFSVPLPGSVESADSGFLFFCPFTHTTVAPSSIPQHQCLFLCLALFLAVPQNWVEWGFELLYSTAPWKFAFLPFWAFWNIFGWVHKVFGAEKSQPQHKFFKKQVRAEGKNGSEISR